MRVVSRKARCEVAVPVHDIYSETNGKYFGPLAVASNSSFAGARMPAYYDVTSIYEYPHYPRIIDNNNSSSGTERDYATTLQIRRTVPPLAAAASCGELWACPVHGRLLSVTPHRATRDAGRVYEVAARLDTVHEHVTPSTDLDAEAATAAGVDDRDVVSPFYHELEPTAMDSTSCLH